MFRYLIAFILILIGALLVLTNIGVIDPYFIDYWHTIIFPFLFIILGTKLFVDDIRKKGGSWIFGSFLVIFGFLLLLGQLMVIDFSFSDIFKLWPLLIIYIGFSIIGRPHRGKKMKISVTTDGKIDQDFEKKKKGHRFSFGDHEFKKANWKVEPMDLFNAAGNYYIDFSKAFIPEKEIPISINSWAGDIQILMPENVAFRIDASVKAGEINVLGESSDGINRKLFYESNDYESAVRKLNITLILKAGSVRVDKV